MVLDGFNLASPLALTHGVEMKTLSYSFLLTLLLTACGEAKSPTTQTPTTSTISTTKPIETSAKEPTPEQRGAKLFKRCRSCHTLEENGRNKVGPNLWGMYGAKAGTKEAYAYSKAMLESGIIWDETTVDAYLKKPAKFLPRTKMAFIGLKKQEDRDAIQTYLKAKTSP